MPFPALFEAASGITEITKAADIDITDAFSSPSSMTRSLSKGIDAIIPGDWDSEIKSEMDELLGISDLDEYSTTGRDSIKQSVTIFPTGNPQSRMAVGFGNPFEPKVGADLNINGSTEEPIISPFSLYYPSFAWPFMTEEGKRYTVVDLGNEPIDLPAGDWIGWLMGRKLDRVAALPGFRVWGDPLLGLGAAVPAIVVSLPLILTAPFWGPPLGMSLGRAGTAFVDSSAEILGAIGGGLAATRKALLAPIRGLGSVSISGIFDFKGRSLGNDYTQLTEERSKLQTSLDKVNEQIDEITSAI